MERTLLLNPAATDQPSRHHLGRPPGSKSSYYRALEKQAARMANLKDGMVVDPLLRLSEAQQILSISYSTIRGLIRRGELRVSRTSQKKGHYRVRLSELQRVAAASAQGVSQ